MNIKLFIQGIIIGIGKIIPGVSGSLLAISMGIYDIALDSITNFFSNVKINTRFLMTLALGIITSIILFSKIIIYFIDKYYIATMTLFIGLILGGLLVFKNKYVVNRRNIFITIISIVFIILLSLCINNIKYICNNNYLLLLISGIIDAFATITPGISATSLLINIGVYKDIMLSISSITNINILSYNLNILVPFIIGWVVGFIILSIIINYLFKKYYNTIISIIMGISISSILLLFISLLKYSINIYYLSIYVIIFIFGIYIGRLFSE